MDAAAGSPDAAVAQLLAAWRAGELSHVMPRMVHAGKTAPGALHAMPLRAIIQRLLADGQGAVVYGMVEEVVAAVAAPGLREAASSLEPAKPRDHVGLRYAKLEKDHRHRVSWNTWCFALASVPAVHQQAAACDMQALVVHALTAAPQPNMWLEDSKKDVVSVWLRAAKATAHPERERWSRLWLLWRTVPRPLCLLPHVRKLAGQGPMHWSLLLLLLGGCRPALASAVIPALLPDAVARAKVDAALTRVNAVFCRFQLQGLCESPLQARPPAGEETKEEAAADPDQFPLDSVFTSILSAMLQRILAEEGAPQGKAELMQRIRAALQSGSPTALLEAALQCCMAFLPMRGTPPPRGPPGANGIRHMQFMLSQEVAIADLDAAASGQSQCSMKLSAMRHSETMSRMQSHWHAVHGGDDGAAYCAPYSQLMHRWGSVA